MTGIYAIKDKTTDKLYIGSAICIKTRFRDHKRLLSQKKHPNKFLENAWHKYGSTNFEFQILESDIKKDKLIEREQYWIDYYKSFDKQYGYNLCPRAGNTLGRKMSETAREKLKGPFWMRRKKKERSDRARRAVNTRWERYHAEKASEQAAIMIPDPCYRLTIQNFITGESHILEFHPKDRLNRFSITVDGKPWTICGWSQALAKIRKSYVRMARIS